MSELRTRRILHERETRIFRRFNSLLVRGLERKFDVEIEIRNLRNTQEGYS